MCGWNMWGAIIIESEHGSCYLLGGTVQYGTWGSANHRSKAARMSGIDYTIRLCGSKEYYIPCACAARE